METLRRKNRLKRHPPRVNHNQTMRVEKTSGKDSVMIELMLRTSQTPVNHQESIRSRHQQIPGQLIPRQSVRKIRPGRRRVQYTQKPQRGKDRNPKAAKSEVEAGAEDPNTTLQAQLSLQMMLPQKSITKQQPHTAAAPTRISNSLLANSQDAAIHPVSTVCGKWTW